MSTTEQTVWKVRDGGAAMMGMALGFLLALISPFLFMVLPKVTGQSATVAIPAVLLAIAGWMIWRGAKIPEIHIRGTTLTHKLGNKERTFDLGKSRWGYARVRQPHIGVVGTALIVQDDEGSLMIGGHQFMFDDPSLYRVGDVQQSDVWVSNEHAFRNLITSFERSSERAPRQAVAGSSTRTVSRADAHANAISLAGVTTFQLEKNIMGSAAVSTVLGGNIAIAVIGTVGSLVGMKAGVAAGLSAAFVTLVAAVAGWIWHRRRNAPPTIAIAKSGLVGLYRHGAQISECAPSELAWSAGRHPTGTNQHRWDMPVIVLQFPGQRKAMSIGTLDRIAWKEDRPNVGAPVFLLGSAEWRHLLRCLGLGDAIR